jgi:precorrin-4 methylase
MGVFKFSAVEAQVMEDIFEPEHLAATVPGIAEVQDAAAMLRSIANEEVRLSRFRKASGMTEHGTMQRMAKIDTTLQIALEELHEVMCDCGRPLFGGKGHKEFFLAWLETPEGKPYDVRRKVTL